MIPSDLQLLINNSTSNETQKHQFDTVDFLPEPLISLTAPKSEYTQSLNP